MKTVLMTLGIALMLAVLGGLMVIYSGAFNVATEWKDPALVQWVLETTMDQSVKRRAASIEAPSLDDPQQIKEGFRSYRDMCALCHTPPGASVSQTAKGLNPAPPDLAKEVEDLSDAELFWMIKNGIRMTGMPAWGPTHEDHELWNIVAFIRTLPEMSSEDYRALDRELPEGHSHAGDEDGHGNGHEDGAIEGHRHDDVFDDAPGEPMEDSAH